MWRYLFPLALFISLALFFIHGLQRDPRHIPSPLIDKPAPAFNLPTLRDPSSKIKLDELKGKVVLINVWASWCAACVEEHPVLLEAVENTSLNLYGLNYKDTRQDALSWLEKRGDPYLKNAFDQTGETGIDYGVYGVPETFLLDKNSIIRYKHLGPLTRQQINTVIFPLVKKLEASP